MNADYLRETAALMRERAEAATPGPWDVDEVGAVWAQEADGQPVHISSRATDEDAEHIASWHPDVALAVADLLDDGAAYLEFVEQMHAEEGPGDEGRLFLAVARTYRGES